MQNYGLVLNPGDSGTFGHVWRHFQVSLLEGRCAGIQWAKMPTRIPLKPYSAQNSLAAKNHLPPKVNNDKAEKS